MSDAPMRARTTRAGRADAPIVVSFAARPGLRFLDPA